jgi:hypothetical protein
MMTVGFALLRLLYKQMKIALHNTFYGGQLAEAELSRRLMIAAKNLGWDAREVGYSDAIWEYDPDFVLNLHFRTPKLTSHPTYGCLWHPTVLVETQKEFGRNVWSYDAFLSSSPQIDRWLNDQFYNTPKQYFVAPFFTSCNATTYQAPKLDFPRLMYVGSNWDGDRYKDLFLRLEQQGYIDIYGNPAGWTYLNSAYRGSLPFDGSSVLNALNQAGVGLCLHRPEHTQEGVPSMRIFEIVAAGAIAICGEHAFIRDNFADTVLYLDPDLDATAQVAQIMGHLDWIKCHPKTALEMTQAAHDIFIKEFALEILLRNLQDQHENSLKAKKITYPTLKASDITTSIASGNHSAVQLILRIGDRDPFQLEKTLRSVEAQTYRNISILVIEGQKSNELSSIIDDYQKDLSIQILDCEENQLRSTELWTAINSISMQYFGLLTSGTILYPTHLHTLVSILNQFPQLGLTYSEVIQTSLEHTHQPLGDNFYEIIDRAKLAQQSLNLMDLLPATHFIHTNNFLARSSLLDAFLKQDPKLDALEDEFLLLNLLARGTAMFSYEVTCQIEAECWQPAESAQAPDPKIQALRRIQVMMRDREFASGHFGYFTKPMQIRINQLETELQQAQQRITAMETSKFWQLRTRWLQLKRKLKP